MVAIAGGKGQGTSMERFRFAAMITPIAYLGLIALIIVFAHSGLQSDNGLAAFREAGSEERRLKSELDALTAQRKHIENKVNRLSEASLDLDLLDERARAVLGLAREDEMIVR